MPTQLSAKDRKNHLKPICKISTIIADSPLQFGSFRSDPSPHPASRSMTAPTRTRLSSEAKKENYFD